MLHLFYEMKVAGIQKKLKKLASKPNYQKECVTENRQRIIIKTDCLLADFEYTRIFEFVEEELYEETSLLTVSRKICECFFHGCKTVAINEKDETYEVLILSEVLKI